MRDRDTPLKIVRRLERQFPGCWAHLDTCYNAKTNGQMDWPDYCHLPISAAGTVLQECYGLNPAQSAAFCAELTACYIWRKRKVIYSFDSELAQTLAAQAYDLEDTDILPVDLLLHLPYPCIYLKAPGLLEDIDGFWLWIEYDTERNAPELRVQHVTFDLSFSVPAVLHLVPGGTLKDCIDDTNAEIAKYSPDPGSLADGVDSIRYLLTAVQLALYLSSDQPDVQREIAPAPVRRHRRKGGGKPPRKKSTDKAGSVENNLVGLRIGSVLRKSRTRYAPSGTATGTGTGSGKRPHSRRGHWHHYWMGPKNSDQRKLILKWTAPTFIHADDDDIAIYPVK